MRGADLRHLTGPQLISLMAAGPDAIAAVMLAQGVVERYQMYSSSSMRYASATHAALGDLTEDELLQAADGLVFLSGVLPTTAALRRYRFASNYRIDRSLTDSTRLVVQGGDVMISGTGSLYNRRTVVITFNYHPADWVCASCQAVSPEIERLQERYAVLEGHGGEAHGCTYRISRLVQTDYEHEVLARLNKVGAMGHLGASAGVADLIEKAFFQSTRVEVEALLMAAIEAASDPGDAIEVEVAAGLAWGATPMGKRVIALAQVKAAELRERKGAR